MIFLRHVLTVAILSFINGRGILKVWGSTSGQGCETLGGKKCLFPFKYNSITYSNCTTINNGGKLWCSTKNDQHGNYIKPYWGYCDVISCSECKTVGGQKCVFPFKYKSVPYSACTTTLNGGRLWCATKTDKNGNIIPGNWDDCDDSICPGASCLQPESNLYRGSQNEDETNRVCKKWSDTSYTPAKYPNRGLDGNDCRVPNSGSYRIPGNPPIPGFHGFFPWCYLEKPYTKQSWGFCDVQPCGKYEGTKISILSYNVELPLSTDPNTGQFKIHFDFKNRVQRLPAALVGLSKMFSVRMPDVILLQECATVFLLQLLDEPLGEGKTLKDYYPYHHSGPEEGSRNQILSKHPIVEKGTAYGFPLAKINVGGFYPKYIHIVSVHLAAFYGRTHARVQEWDGIRKALIKKNIPKTEPILIGGDFNAEMFEVLKMQDAVVNYDFTKQDIFDEEGKFFPASWSVKTNWRILLVRYPEYPKRYGETFDYVVTLQSHLQPSLSKEMKVLLLKFDKSWEVYNDGQNPIEGKYPGYKFLINGTWVENPDKTNKFYNDLADHYPVYQEYVFRLDKSLL